MTSTTMREIHTILSVVDGGKRIVILEDSYGDLYKGYIRKTRQRLITIPLAGKKYLNKMQKPIIPLGVMGFFTYKYDINL